MPKTNHPSDTELANRALAKYTYVDLDWVKHMWKSPGRVYHDIGHAAHMMAILRTDKNIPTQHKEALVVAVLFHDIIYVIGHPNNEEASASLLSTVLKEDVSTHEGLALLNAVRLTRYDNKYRIDSDQLPVAYWLRYLDLYDLHTPDEVTIKQNYKNVRAEWREKTDIETFHVRHREILTDIMKNSLVGIGDEHIRIILQWTDEAKQDLIDEFKNYPNRQP